MEEDLSDNEASRETQPHEKGDHQDQQDGGGEDSARALATTTNPDNLITVEQGMNLPNLATGESGEAATGKSKETLNSATHRRGQPNSYSKSAADWEGRSDSQAAEEDSQRMALGRASNGLPPTNEGPLSPILQRENPKVTLDRTEGALSSRGNSPTALERGKNSHEDDNMGKNGLGRDGTREQGTESWDATHGPVFTKASVTQVRDTLGMKEIRSKMLPDTNANSIESTYPGQDPTTLRAMNNSLTIK